MVWFIAACAILVLVAASFAAIGRFGALREPVVDTFAPAALADPATPLRADELRFGREFRGYAPSSVDSFLATVATQALTPAQIAAARFPTASPGYAMDQVDAALERLARQAAGPVAAVGAERQSAPAAGAVPAGRE